MDLYPGEHSKVMTDLMKTAEVGTLLMVLHHLLSVLDRRSTRW